MDDVTQSECLASGEKVSPALVFICLSVKHIETSSPVILWPTGANWGYVRRSSGHAIIH